MTASTYPLTLYYDGACPMCRIEMQNLMLRNDAGQLRFEDVQATQFVCPDGVSPDTLLQRMHARCADGRWLQGVPAFEAAYAGVGLAWVMAPARNRIVRAALERLYPLVARHRYRVPTWAVQLVFGPALRRAARRAAAQQCTDQCTRSNMDS